MPAADTGQLLLHCHPLGYDFQQPYKPWNHRRLRAIKYCFNQKPLENTKASQLLQSQPPHQNSSIIQVLTGEVRNHSDSRGGIKEESTKSQGLRLEL